MIKRYGIILTLYIIATSALLIVACAKQDTISIPEQRPPVQLPDIEEEEIYGGALPETDTAQPAEVEEEDLLDDDEQ
tara:strand:- start:1123 stop:1353 length:231 start_codon:yes stop_codon:yes gene_type:complete